MSLGLSLILVTAVSIAAVGTSLYMLHAKHRYSLLAKELHRKNEDLEIFQVELDGEFDRLRLAERDLRENEAFAESLFQATQAGLILLNPDSRQIMDINSYGAEILGATTGDIIGENAIKFNLTTESSSIQFFENQQVEFTRLDGTKVSVLHSTTPMWGQSSKIVLFTFLDITELKEKEKELEEFNKKLGQMMDEVNKSKQRVAQSEKLASIGQLAAGVAHEINNPIGFITSNLSSIQEYSATMKNLLLLYQELELMADENGGDRQKLLARIAKIREDEDLEFILDDLENVLGESLDGVNRVTEIVQNLKSFARTDSKTLELHDINEGLESMIKMVWNELKYHCTMEKNLNELPPIRCHPGQINQVIMNILVNAGQAIGENEGTIKVSTELVDSEVLMIIKDTGSGMPPEVLSHIFDPFFTTKDVGKGTGLGLSISHGIIENHGGRIEVNSEMGVGTEFRIYLPFITDLVEGDKLQSPVPSETHLIG